MKHIKIFENFISEEATLFGDMNDYIDRFKSAEGWRVGEESKRVAGTPDEFPEVDAKGNWRKDGWNYTSIRSYAPGDKFKSSTEILDFFKNIVISPNKKEWTLSNIRKPNSIFDFNKKDKTMVFEHPALGFIFLYVWDPSTDNSRKEWQIKAMFMNAKSYRGSISNIEGLNDKIDSIVNDKTAADAVIDYLKSKYN